MCNFDQSDDELHQNGWSVSLGPWTNGEDSGEIVAGIGDLVHGEVP